MTYPNGYAGDLDVESMAAELRLAQRQRDEAVTSVMDLSVQLADTNSTLGTLRETLSDARARHKADIELIGNTLLEATADDPDVYDENVYFLNGRIAYELPTRNREYAVSYSVTVTFTVDASDEDSAREEARPDMSRIESAIDSFSLYGGANGVTSSVDYSADVERNDDY